MPTVNSIKSLNLFTHARYREIEFCQMDGCKRAMKGLMILTAISFLIPVVIALYGAMIKKSPTTKKESVFSKTILSKDFETVEFDNTVYPPVIELSEEEGRRLKK